MRKYCLILFCFTFCSFTPVREKVIATYTAEIGVRETTNNHGQRVEQYLKSVNRLPGDAWCAAFVSWCLEESAVANCQSGWSPSWHPKSKLIYRPSSGIHKMDPRPGDVFGIWFIKLNRLAHTGFIDDWASNDKFCTTVEGNTNDAGSREGDGVYKKRRIKRQIHSVSNWIND